MQDKNKTKKQLIDELASSRRRIKKLEKSGSEHKQIEKRDLNIFDNSISGIALHDIVTDENGKPVDYIFLEANSAFEKLIGLKVKDIIGKRVTEVIPGIGDSPFFEIYGKVALTGKSVQFEQYAPPLKKHLKIMAFSPRKGQFAAVFSDITARKQAEEELEREKRFSETIINAITDTVFVFDPQTGKAVKWNRAFREVSGYTDEEIAAKKSPDEWYSKEDFEKATVEMKKLVAGGQSRVEMSLITKDGSTIPTEYIAEIIEDEEGNPTYIVAAGRGISERKQAEEALHKERDFADSLINTAQAIILVLDTEGRMVRINPFMEEISGYSMEEVKGKDWFSTFLPKQDYAKIRKLFTKAVSDIQISGNVNSIMTKDGRELEIEWYNKTLKDAKGNIVGVLAIGQDITERKRTEEALQVSEAKYRSIFKNTGTAAAIIEADMTMSLVNSEMVKLTGFSKKEIENKKKWTELVLKEDLARMKKYHVSRRKDGGKAPKRYEARLVNRAGEIRYGIVIVDMIPGTKQSVASILDITEHKEIDDKIKASLKEKEVLLQEIHHRVKNNMQIVVSLLRLQSYAAKDKKIEDMFKVAQNRIRSMAIIHEKLYKSKDFASIDFAHYILSLANHLMQTYQIDPKKITLIADVKDIHLDINQGIPVGLLLNELISNALKHAFPNGKKGEIIVKFHTDKKGKKTLNVSDNGIGYPDKVDISKPKTLGMQLIKDLTKQIGGKLDLDNKAGTTFKITFS